MLPGDDEVALVLADVAEEEVVDKAAVEVSEDKEVSRRADEGGRELVPSLAFPWSAERDGSVGAGF